ncbi:MAG: HNH endonuclease [Polyangiales bacterium]
MSARKQRLLRLVANSDNTFERRVSRGEEVLQGKCIHCQRKLTLDLDGRALGDATLEHIIPRHHGGTDDLENLAIACARCNSEKGLRHDHKSKDDPALRAVIETLEARRRARFRDPDRS